jgi:hypothetical protein
MQTPQNVELIVFVEHCPLKLQSTTNMTIAQALYTLKEAIFGFERLYSKFGPFQVFENMIALNEKGSCRVWINEDFSLNSCLTINLTEEAMVSSIISIMQKHCLECPVSNKLAKQLHHCKSFLSVLK